ncbi:MAG: FAD-dependent oxidoreductase [Deltaproteobacteria bacterium]|nr:FAD-dependent oxidoreductase [Deltaproteobacteria bacterium]
MYESLFSEIRLGQTTLANRIVFGAHRTNLARHGLVGEAMLAYYHRRAQGGCGAVVVGEASLVASDHPWELMIEAFRLEAAQGLSRLVRAIQDSGSRAFLNLNFHGFQSSGAISRREVWGPSAVADIAFGETAKAMEAEDIAAVVEAFVRGVELARETGFDGVVVDVGPESLLRQFLSPICNFRQDQYGGELANRMRLSLEVMQAVRQAVGQDFTMGASLSLDEKFWGGIDIEAAKEISQAFEDQGGVDFISGTVGTYYNLYLVHPSMHTPAGFAVELAEQVKQAVSVPVIANHQIPGPEMAEEIVSQGRADAVGLVRPLICDPDLPLKAREGRAQEIRPCLWDNQGCMGRVNNSRGIGCILNPEAGLETKAVLPSKEEAPREVMVVGAGPAGMEAAATAAERGCLVTLLDRAPEIGGQLRLAGRGAGRERLLLGVEYLTQRLDRLRVEVRADTEATPEMIAQAGPDAVIVATGSSPNPRPFAGEYGAPRVLDVRQVLAKEHPVGDRVLLIDGDGGHKATAVAELMADEGKRVTMVTEELFVGVSLGPLGDLYFSRQRLLQKNVVFVCDVRIDRIEGCRVEGREKFSNQPIVFDDQDTVVLALGSLPEDDLYQRLKGKVAQLLRVGDCVAPRDIGSAVLEGRRAGERL